MEELLTQAEFIAWYEQNKDATQAEAAAHFGVSKQRINQVCALHGIRLNRSRVVNRPKPPAPYVGRTFLGNYLERSGRSDYFQYGTTRNSGSVAELYVAADLIAHGLGVFAPMHPAAHCDLIAVLDGRCFKIEVKANTAQPDGSKSSTTWFDVLARVTVDGEIIYSPQHGVDWPIKDGRHQ